jgi:excisionase family DNA binding protein
VWYLEDTYNTPALRYSPRSFPPEHARLNVQASVPAAAAGPQRARTFIDGLGMVSVALQPDNGTLRAATLQPLLNGLRTAFAPFRTYGRPRHRAKCTADHLRSDDVSHEVVRADADAETSHRVRRAARLSMTQESAGLITVSEAARRLGVGESALRHLVQRGRLAAVRPGKGLPLVLHLAAAKAALAERRTERSSFAALPRHDDHAVALVAALSSAQPAAELVSIAVASHRFNVPYAVLRLLVQQGRLPTSRHGRVLGVSMADVAAALAERAQRLAGRAAR